MSAITVFLTIFNNRSNTTPEGMRGHASIWVSAFLEGGSSGLFPCYSDARKPSDQPGTEVAGVPAWLGCGALVTAV